MLLRFLLVLPLISVVITVSCVRSDQSDLDGGYTSQDSLDAFQVTQMSFADLKLYTSAYLKSSPWGDDYWSLKFAGISKQWIMEQSRYDEVKAEIDRDHQQSRTEVLGDYFKLSSDSSHSEAIDSRLEESKAALAVNSQDAMATVHFSPVEKYDAITGGGEFPMSRQELGFYRTWFENSNGDEEQLEWMGYCDGWSVSSLVIEAPKNAVLVENAKTGVQSLFTEGDIRALYTKAASEDANGMTGEYEQIGRRCTKEDDVLTVVDGRIIDGQIGSWNFDRNTWASQSEIKVLDYKMLWSDGLGREVLDYAVIEIAGDQDVNRYKVVNQVDAQSGEKTIYNDDLYFVKSYRYLKSGKLSKRESNLGAYLVFNKHCKDVNPASFHSLLVSAYAGPKQNGFVMDVDRNFQVWNHPVHGYEAKLGELTPLTIAGKDDPFLEYRAEGTEFIADVYLKLSYAVEVQPSVKYQKEEGNLSKKVFHYILEFDKDQKLIGGEWAHLPEEMSLMLDKELPEPLAGEALLDYLKSESSAEDLAFFSPIPDNIWRYSGDVDFGNPGTEGSFDKNFLDFIRDCASGQGKKMSPYSIFQLQEYYDESTGDFLELETVTGDMTYCVWN